MSSSSALLSDYPLTSKLHLKNRIVMAPMTRCMADDDLVPIPAMTDYYARRAAAGLIITEGTIIRPDGLGYYNTPGIFTAEQIKAWQAVTQAVHAQDGLIFLQIWHVGRVSHPVFLNGDLPISCSATLMKERVSRMTDLHYGASRAASLDDIQELIACFAQAAANAIEAGFDGVEIHGANGYLIDQFLHHSTNLRDDEYGNSIENKARFALEVVNACGAAIGYDRVGLRLSPAAYLNEIQSDPRDAAVFAFLLEELNDLSLAYVHTGNFDDSVQFAELNQKSMTQFLRSHYRGTLIACGSYDISTATTGLAQHAYDLVGIGRPFIANPDLIEKIQNNTPWQAYSDTMLATLY